jgi:hypothetical protein
MNIEKSIQNLEELLTKTEDRSLSSATIESNLTEANKLFTESQESLNNLESLMLELASNNK